MAAISTVSLSTRNHPKTTLRMWEEKIWWELKKGCGKKFLMIIAPHASHLDMRISNIPEYVNVQKMIHRVL